MKYFLFILTFFVISLTGFSFWQYLRIESLRRELIHIETTETTPSSFSQIPLTPTPLAFECDDECRQEIKQEVTSQLALITISPQQTVASVKKQISFIPLGGGSTTSTDWVNLEDTAVTFDLVADYSVSATASWEASIKASDGGAVFVRLFDATHGIAVDMSELTTSQTKYELVSSNTIPLWRGRNTYRIQIKSLNGSEVTVSGGRIKVQY